MLEAGISILIVWAVVNLKCGWSKVAKRYVKQALFQNATGLSAKNCMFTVGKPLRPNGHIKT